MTVLVTSLVALLPLCAPAIDPSTALRLIEAESAGRQFAININGAYRLSRQPRSYAEFESVVRALDAAGHNFDYGFAQANNREVKRRGYAVLDKADPCANLGFMQEVLSGCFDAAPRGTNMQRRIGDALSCYNTGRFASGYHNGYVHRVWHAIPRSTLTASAVMPLHKAPAQLKEKRT